MISDYFTKLTEALPMVNMEATTVACLFVNKFSCRYGVPHFLHTDQGGNIQSFLIREVCHLLGICKTCTTAYHLQSDEMVELEIQLRSLEHVEHSGSRTQTWWDLYLLTVMMAYFSSIYEMTGATPLSLMFGWQVLLPVDLMFQSPHNYPSLTSTSMYAHNLSECLHQA